MWNEEEEKEREINEAKATLIKTKAAIMLAENNWYGCEINIAGLKVGICDNSSVIPALKKHKQEIEKFLKGKPNMYE